MVKRAGIGLAEVAVAAALFALLGIAVYTVLSTGASGAARSSEVELAATLGARIVDRLLASGFDGLAPLAGGEGDLDLGQLAGTGGDAASGALELDCVSFRARYRIERAAEGLLELELSIAWQRHGGAAAGSSGSIKLIRLIADPRAADDARAPFPS